MGKLSTPIIFGAIAILGAVSLGIIALHQGESISAVWMVVAAVCTIFVVISLLVERFLHYLGKVRALLTPFLPF